MEKDRILALVQAVDDTVAKPVMDLDKPFLILVDSNCVYQNNTPNLWSCLLRNMDIVANSCVLHWDYYHLLNETWPNKDNFDETALKSTKKYIYLILI